MNSLAVRCLGTRYRYIMDEHLNYFTARTLRRLVEAERMFAVVTLNSTHFNPIVIWQDWRGGARRVPDAERAQLLKRTTRWKQNALLSPVKWIYHGVERILGSLHLADNLVVILKRR
jgi:hypothetical protein